jgi:hypothetical protein
MCAVRKQSTRSRWPCAGGVELLWLVMQFWSYASLCEVTASSSLPEQLEVCGAEFGTPCALQDACMRLDSFPVVIKEHSTRVRTPARCARAIFSLTSASCLSSPKRPAGRSPENRGTPQAKNKHEVSRSEANIVPLSTCSHATNGAACSAG